MHAHQKTVAVTYIAAASARSNRARNRPDGERQQDVEQDRVGEGDQRQAGDERPRIGRHDQAGQRVREPDRDEQRAEPVVRPPLPRAQAGEDRRPADQRPEDGDQVAVVATDAVDRDREGHGAGDKTERSEDAQHPLQAWRGGRQGALEPSRMPTHGRISRRQARRARRRARRARQA
jgi:hypothetical protein